MRQPLNIGIAGAGIGGLAAAALLFDRGHKVTVFDQFDAPRPVGSGLVIQPVGQAVLEMIGVRERAMNFGAPLTRLFGHEARDGRTVLDVSYSHKRAERVGLGIHRASLFQTLWDAVAERGIEIRPGHPIAGRTGQTLHFDGQPDAGPFDLIIDAAGAGSPLSPLRGRALPYGAIWGTVDWPETDLPWDELRQCYSRADRMIGVLPIGTLPDDTTPKAALFWSLPEGAHGDWLAAGLPAWRAEATALWPDLAPFIDQVTDPDQMTMARYTHGTLFKPFAEGLAHIGDAAHRASPQLGQGANMALLDAAALTAALETEPPHVALLNYARARRAHVWTYQLFSAAFTPQYQSGSRILPVIRDRLLTPLSQTPPLPRILSALVAGTIVPPLGALGGATASLGGS